MIDETHDPGALCWVPGADDHPDFPVQNLPFGLFSAEDGPARTGVAIGDYILDLGAVVPLLDVPIADPVADAIAAPTLNSLLALPAGDRRALRQAIFRHLTDPAQAAAQAGWLRHSGDCRLHLPVQVRDFTDFYAGIHHARAVGSLLRPENPLLPNYKYVPVGYHGRASTVRASGGSIVRPRGQLKSLDAEPPVLGPSQRLDYEVELGIWIGGRSDPGSPIAIADAPEHIAGVCLLNDWSARDFQAWEYQPLGPFLAKNFATTVSPWVVTREALAPFAAAQFARPDGDPAPLPYLWHDGDQRRGALDIELEVSIRTPRMRCEGAAPARLGRTRATNLFWTPSQLVAHHSVNGCDLAAGDLLGTGTISGPTDDARGSLMELSRGGHEPVILPNGEERTFLEDGDEVSIAGWAERSGFRRIGFGPCTATIAAAV